MKRLKTLFILVFLSQIAIGQEFSFNMYFEDAAGNKDSLTIGYDLSGTDTIDPEFGEINIISVPLDLSLDVRISNEWNNRVYHNIPGTFHTKKQIIKKQECGGYYTINSIDIFTDNWPVFVYWDSTLFADTCLNGSLFTSVMPGGWWDTGGFIEVLQSNSSSSFTPNYPNYNDYYGYITDNNDTIDVFWQTFADSTIFMVGMEETINNEIRIFPNPTSDKVIIDLKNQDQRIENIRVFDIHGRIRPVIRIKNEIDFSNEANGLYFIYLQLTNGKVLVQKVLKKNAH